MNDRSAKNNKLKNVLQTLQGSQYQLCLKCPETISHNILLVQNFMETLLHPCIYSHPVCEGTFRRRQMTKPDKEYSSTLTIQDCVKKIGCV